METRKFLLDMDVGIDDAVAIIFLAMQSNTEIVALGSVHGNVDSPTAALNALRTFEICGKYNIPVAIGATDPMAQPVVISNHVHGDDGLGNTYPPMPQGRPTNESAVDQILRLSHEYEGQIDLLAVGPLTNIGLALQRDPMVLTRFRSTVIMGGAGKEQPADEPLFGYDANIDHDPHAAGIALDFDSVVTEYVDAPAEVIQTANGKRGVVAISPNFPDRPVTRMILGVDVPKFIEWQVQALV